MGVRACAGILLVALLVAPSERAAAETALAAAEKLLASKDWQDRVKAIEQIEALAKSAAGEKDVSALLADEDWGVEIRACAALAKIGGDASADPLAKLCVEGEIQWVRDAAIEALRAVDPKEGAARVLEFTRGSGAKDLAPRARALVAAGRVGPASTLKRLSFFAKAKEPEIAAAAMNGVAALAADPAAAKDVLRLVDEHLASRADHKDFLVYAACLDALGRVAGSEAAAKLVDELLAQPDDDLYAQERICRGFDERPADETATALRAGLAKAKKAEETRRVARAVGRLKCAALRGDVVPLLDHREERVRSEAAKALGLLGDAASADALRKALDDKSVFVRMEAVSALARVLPRADFRALGERLAKDASEPVRLQFVVETADAGDPAGIETLGAFLDDAEWRPASAAAAAIGTLGVASDLPRLQPLLAHKSWQVRAAAYEGLGRLRTANAIPLLIDGLSDKESVVRGVCIADLQILTRQKWGPDAKAWREWWTKYGSSLSIVKKSRRTDEEKRKDAERNKDYGNQSPTQAQGVEILQKARILVVTGAWDHVEKVLGHLEIPFTLLRAQQLKENGLSPNQIVLVNCEGNMDAESRARVQWFVAVGGYLMTTDWALTKTVEPAFPGYLQQFSKSSTGNDVVVVEDARPGHPFTRGIFDHVPALKWWLEVQAFPMTVTWPERVDVLVDSQEMRRRYGSSPMAATFRWGLGKVQHSVSHFYLQEEGLVQAQKGRERMVFAADNLGLSLDEIRKMAKEGAFDAPLNDDVMKKIAPDYSMFRLIVNVVKEKSDWVENL